MHYLPQKVESTLKAQIHSKSRCTHISVDTTPGVCIANMDRWQNLYVTQTLEAMQTGKIIWAEHVTGWSFTPNSKQAIVLHYVSIRPVLSYSRETYNALTNWLTDARTLASPNIVIILCGNKKDLDADREVTFLEASRFAQENGNWC